jgi:hypothetical protein
MPEQPRERLAYQRGFEAGRVAERGSLADRIFACAVAVTLPHVDGAETSAVLVSDLRAILLSDTRVRQETYEATCPQCGSRDDYSEPHPGEHTCGHVIPQPTGIPAGVLTGLVQANRVSLARERETCLPCYDDDHRNCEEGKPGVAGYLMRCKCLCKPGRAKGAAQ